MLKKHEVRSLLKIKSRDTINEDLKVLGLLDCKQFNWSQVRKLLEVRLFLGLKPGINSREEFIEIPQEQLAIMFSEHGLNVEEHFKSLQSQHESDHRSQYQHKHRVSVQLVLDRE